MVAKKKLVLMAVQHVQPWQKGEMSILYLNKLARPYNVHTESHGNWPSCSKKNIQGSLPVMDLATILVSI